MGQNTNGEHMINSLADTISYMVSGDYKERFIGELFQLKIRAKKLEDAISRYDREVFDCPKALLEAQLNVMKDYIVILMARANIEFTDEEKVKYGLVEPKKD